MKNIGKQIEIEPVTLADILLAIELCPVEISGFARVRETEDCFSIYDEPEVFKQKCGMSGTEFDLEALGAWNHIMMKSGNGHEINDYRLWWHSHVFSPAYFSGTDRRQIESWEDGRAPWWISLVGNKHGKLTFRIDFYGEERATTNPEVRCTEPINRKELQTLMLSRKLRMAEIIRERVVFDDRAAFEHILDGVFK